MLFTRRSTYTRTCFPGILFFSSPLTIILKNRIIIVIDSLQREVRNYTHGRTSRPHARIPEQRTHTCEPVNVRVSRLSHTLIVIGRITPFVLADRNIGQSFMTAGNAIFHLSSSLIKRSSFNFNRHFDFAS